MTEHPDISRARELLALDVWNIELLDELIALVKRNEVGGTPLGRERYIIMRELWWKLEPWLKQLDSARRAFEAVDEAGDDERAQEQARLDAEERPWREPRP